MKLIVYQENSGDGRVIIGNVCCDRRFKTPEDISDFIEEIKDERKANEVVILNIIELSI